ncbi:tetratricopeptide repeat protein [Dyella sp.]|uniref:tetratricopeptide repeat protein n=1 Tax=Dyella sp. TaxID=1869338 RepID=UPI002ED1EF64
MLLALVGCAAAPGRGGSGASTSRQPLDHLVVATPDADHDLLAQLLTGEMALTRTDLKDASAAYDRAMMLSDDPHVAEQSAGIAIAIRDDGAAQRAIDRWATLGASPANLAEARAQLALGQGNSAEAQKQLELLTQSGDMDAWRLFGRVLVGSRDPALAGQLLETIATPQRLPQHDAQAWLAMSELGERLGRQGYAQQIADAAVKRFNSADTYAWAAQLKYKAGDRKGAQVLFQKAIAKEPRNVRLRLAYASVLGQNGDYASASKLLDSGPQDADTFQLRAALAAHANDTRTLNRLYNQLQHSPEDVRDQSAYLLGQLAEMQGQKQDALKWYGQVPDEDEHAFDADLRSAVLLLETGRAADAHAQLEEMQTDYLDQPAQLRRAYEVDAELYMREQNYAKAEAAYTRALQIAADDPALLYGRGIAYASDGKVDQAVGDLRRLLQLKPNDADASNALGFTLADANRDLSEAEQLIQVARAAKPNDPAIADSWGWVQYRLGHLDQAEKALTVAWQGQKDADVGVHLGEVLWKRGKQEEARKVFDEVRQMDPKNTSLQDALKRLSP